MVMEKNITKMDIFDKMMELLELLTVASMQGLGYSPKVLFLINETIGELMDDPVTTERTAAMMREVFSESVEEENQKPLAPVIPINKKLN